MNPRTTTHLNPRLSRFGEMLWLLAIAALPTLFMPEANEPFVLPKVHLLYTLGLLLLLFWLSKWFFEGISLRCIYTIWEQFSRHQRLFLLCTIVLLIIFSFSTALSDHPRTGFFGSYQRGNGLLSFGILVLFFLTVLVHLRNREQVQRILYTVVGAAAVVALYSVMQWTSMDPVSWDTDTAFRPPSTLGNPVFSAAFMMLSLPAGIFLVNTTRGAKRIGWVALLGLILVAFYISYSRAPLVGILVSLSFLAVLLAHFKGNAFIKWGITGGCLSLFLLLIVVNLWDSPNNVIRKTPGISRMTNFLDQTRTGQSTAVRILLWEASTKMFKEQPDIWISGAGPDQLKTVITPYLPPDLNYKGYRDVLPDRLHNTLLNTFAELGLVGGVLQLFSSWLLLFLAIQKTGFLSQATSFRQYSIWTLGVAVVLTALVILLDGGHIRFAGLALSLGLFLAAGAFVAFAPMEREHSNTTSLQPLLYGVLAAIVLGHLVEIQFGFSVLSTQLVFWVCAGLILSPYDLTSATPSSPAWPYLLLPLIWFLSSLFGGSLQISAHWYLVSILLPMVVTGLLISFLLPLSDQKSVVHHRRSKMHHIVCAGTGLCILSGGLWSIGNSVEADVLFREARQNEGSSATKLYQASLNLSAMRPAYLLDAARHTLEQGDISSGQALVEQFYPQSPANPTRTRALGQVYLGLAQTNNQVVSSSRSYLQKAIQFSASAVAQWPANPILLNQLFDAQLLAGDQNAVATIQRSFDQDSLFFETHLRMARLASSQRQWALAANHYEMAQAQGANTLAVMSALGFVYAQMGRFQEAIVQNLEVLKERPQDIQTHQNIIILYATQGDCRDAKSHLDRVVHLLEDDRKYLVQDQLFTLCSEEDF